MFAHQAPGPFGAAIAARPDDEIEPFGRLFRLDRREPASFQRGPNLIAMNGISFCTCSLLLPPLSPRHWP